MYRPAVPGLDLCFLPTKGGHICQKGHVMTCPFPASQTGKPTASSFLSSILVNYLNVLSSQAGWLMAVIPAMVGSTVQASLGKK
jgi:hypothetical protein